MWYNTNMKSFEALQANEGALYGEYLKKASRLKLLYGKIYPGKPKDLAEMIMKTTESFAQERSLGEEEKTVLLQRLLDGESFVQVFELKEMPPIGNVAEHAPEASGPEASSDIVPSENNRREATMYKLHNPQDRT